jgi:hypothetical protein
MAEVMKAQAPIYVQTAVDKPLFDRYFLSNFTGFTSVNSFLTTHFSPVHPQKVPQCGVDEFTSKKFT